VIRKLKGFLEGVTDAGEAELDTPGEERLFQAGGFASIKDLKFHLTAFAFI